jgi:hypothetical protein
LGWSPVSCQVMTRRTQGLRVIDSISASTLSGRGGFCRGPGWRPARRVSCRPWPAWCRRTREPGLRAVPGSVPLGDHLRLAVYPAHLPQVPVRPAADHLLVQTRHNLGHRPYRPCSQAPEVVLHHQKRVRQSRDQAPETHDRRKLGLAHYLLHARRGRRGCPADRLQSAHLKICVVLLRVTAERRSRPACPLSLDRERGTVSTPIVPWRPAHQHVGEVRRILYTKCNTVEMLEQIRNKRSFNSVVTIPRIGAYRSNCIKSILCIEKLIMAAGQPRSTVWRPGLGLPPLSALVRNKSVYIQGVLVVIRLHRMLHLTDMRLLCIR